MPKGKVSVPATIKRSPPKARRTYEKTKQSAEEQYGEGERASRTAYAQLKQKFKKVGDHWESKDGQGASDERSAQDSTKAKREGRGKTYGGVDVKGSTKNELQQVAKKMSVSGYSQMNKDELGDAIKKASDKKNS